MIPRPQTPRRSRSRPFILVPLLVLVALVCMVGLPRPASAHLYLKSSDPEARSTVREAPARVVLEFSEQVDLDTARINVLDADENRVDRGDVGQVGDDPYTIQIALADDLPNGPYTVIWRLVAQDGHPRTEQFRFRLRAPTPPSPSPTEEAEGGHGDDEEAAPPAHGDDEAEAPAIHGGGSDAIMGSHTGGLVAFLQGIGKFLVFGSLLALAGLMAFLALVWRRPSGVTADEAAAVDERFARRWRRLVGVAWIVALAASSMNVVLQAAVLADVPLAQVRPGLVADVLDTRFGQMVAIRLGLLGMGALLWVAASRLTGAPLVFRPGGRRPATVGAEAAVAPAPPRAAVWIGGVFVVALLVTVSFAGHAGTASPTALALPADVLHLLAAGAWLGGLLTLVAVSFPATRPVGEVERCRILAPWVARFSNLAVVAIVVIIATGVVRSLIELQGLDGLTTSYGWVLIAKILAFVPALALGAVNNRRTKPACVRAAREGTTTPALGRLRRLVAAEVALGVVVVGLAAFLVNLTPPRTLGEAGAHALGLL